MKQYPFPYEINIYLDIDGVLLTKEGKPAQYVEEFLANLTKYYECYWLNNHCKDGGTSHIMDYLQGKLPQGALQHATMIDAILWETNKIDAVKFIQDSSFNQDDFLWFGSTISKQERQLLEARYSLDNLIQVDLTKQPDFLGTFLEENVYPEHKNELTSCDEYDFSITNS